MMEQDKNSPKRRARSPKETELSERKPVRVAPTDDPAEAVEHVLSRRQLLVEDGDIVIARETAGILRGTFGIESLTGSSSPTYRLIVRGQLDDSWRGFATSELAIVDGESLAAEHRVRLFYDEDAPLTLLKEYRPATKG
jgi:hypothetical protein